jgi:hypothetical protein
VCECHTFTLPYKVTAGTYPTSASTQVPRGRAVRVTPRSFLWWPTALNHSEDTLDVARRSATSLIPGAIGYRTASAVRLIIDLLRECVTPVDRLVTGHIRDFPHTATLLCNKRRDLHRRPVPYRYPYPGPVRRPEACDKRHSTRGRSPDFSKGGSGLR